MNASTLSKFIERHGLATLIVIAGGWYVSQVIVTPLSKSYLALVESVRATNKLVTDEVRLNNLEDAARIAEITRRFDDLDRGIDEILKELRDE
jgi:hypothetical protein